MSNGWCRYRIEAYILWEWLVATSIYTLIALVLTQVYGHVLVLYRDILRQHAVQYNMRFITVLMSHTIMDLLHAVYAHCPECHIDVVVSHANQGHYAPVLMLRTRTDPPIFRQYFFAPGTYSHDDWLSHNHMGFFVDMGAGYQVKEWLLGIDRWRIRCSEQGKDRWRACPSSFAARPIHNKRISGVYIEYSQCVMPKNVHKVKGEEACVEWQQYICLLNDCLSGRKHSGQPHPRASMLTPMLLWVLLLVGLLTSLLRIIGIDLMESHALSLLER